MWKTLGIQCDPKANHKQIQRNNEEECSSVGLGGAVINK